MIIAIMALDHENGLAKNGSIPWKLKDDFKFFKEMTMGSGNNAVVMGRKTMESLPNNILSGRKNILISKTPPGISVDNIKDLPEVYPELKDIFIIGGAEVYNESFQKRIPEKIIISRIHGEFNCDLFIDDVVLRSNYKLVSTEPGMNFDIEYWALK